METNDSLITVLRGIRSSQASYESWRLGYEIIPAVGTEFGRGLNGYLKYTKLPLCLIKHHTIKVHVRAEVQLHTVFFVSSSLE